MKMIEQQKGNHFTLLANHVRSQGQMNPARRTCTLYNNYKYGRPITFS